MARKADTPCAGGCGKLLWGGRGSRPAGVRCCRDCQRAGREPVPPKYNPACIPSRARRFCEVGDCTEPHLAKGMCRKHWRRDRYARGLEGRKDLQPLGALVRRFLEDGEWYGTPWKWIVSAEVTPSLVFPRCPECHRVMFRHPTTRQMLWNCRCCQLGVLLNQEEVEWVIYEKRSTAA